MNVLIKGLHNSDLWVSYPGVYLAVWNGPLGRRHFILVAKKKKSMVMFASSLPSVGPQLVSCVVLMLPKEGKKKGKWCKCVKRVEKCSALLFSKEKNVQEKNANKNSFIEQEKISKISIFSKYLEKKILE